MLFIFKWNILFVYLIVKLKIKEVFFYHLFKKFYFKKLIFPFTKQDYIVLFDNNENETFKLISR